MIGLVWSQSACNAVMLAYTTSLALGYTIRHSTITANTIHLYLNAACDYIQQQRLLFHPRNSTTFLLDPRHDFNIPFTGKVQVNPHHKAVVDELKRWQALTNKRDPLTINMIDDLHRRAAPFPPHSKLQATKDWWIMGIYYGFRCSEYLQRSTVHNVAQAWLNVTDGLPRAFIPADITFYQTGRVALTHAQAQAHPSSVEFVSFRWREQKNGMNGQTKTVARDHSTPDRCPIRAALRIIARHTALQLPSSYPLAVYTPSGLATPADVQLLTDADINKELRVTAVSVYSMSFADASKRYSTHSVRVGACVALHANNGSTIQIKFALRWKSDTFWEYLRDVPLVAARTSRLVGTLDPMNPENPLPPPMSIA
jgi:hypothetical protein